MTSQTAWALAEVGGVIDGEAAAEAGAYSFASDSTITGTINAANAANPRVDLVYAQVSDSAESDGTPNTTPGNVQILYLPGVASSNPSAPATPPRSIPLGTISVPISGGGLPTATWVAPVLAAAGAKLLVPTVANLNACTGWPGAEASVWGETSSLLNGSYRWHVASGQWMKLGIVGESTSTANIDVGTSSTRLASVTVQVFAGARYRVHGYTQGSQATNAGIPNIRLFAGTTEIARLITGVSSMPANAIAIMGDASPIYTATATGTVVFTVSGTSTAPAFRSYALMDVECLG